MTFAVLAAVSVPRLFAITVEVGDGESEAVKIAAENLRIDIARACPNHAKDSRRIVVRTKAGGPWESSTRTYANGVWTVTGADRRGTVYGIYAISDELGVSPFHWMDDIPVAQCEKFDLSTKTKDRRAPVKYRGIFINDEGWCLRSWAVHNYEKDGTKSLGSKSYEKIFELMLRCRLNVIWPARCIRSIRTSAETAGDGGRTTLRSKGALTTLTSSALGLWNASRGFTRT